MCSSGGNPGSCVLELKKQKTEKGHRDTAVAEHSLLRKDLFSREEVDWSKERELSSSVSQ